MCNNMYVSELRDRREAAGLSQGNLAEMIGVTQQAISRIELGLSAGLPVVHMAIDRALDDAEHDRN